VRQSSIPSARSKRAWALRTSYENTAKGIAAEMALSVLAYNLTRVINILGIGPLIAAIRA